MKNINYYLSSIIYHLRSKTSSLLPTTYSLQPGFLRRLQPTPYNLSPRARGFTLIELLLYTSMVGIILFAIAGMYSSLLSSRIKNQAINEVEQQGVVVIQQMTQTIRNATSITSPTAGVSGSTLTLSVTSGSLSPTIFDVLGSAIQVKEGAAGAIPLTSSRVTVSGFTVTNLGRSGTSGNIRIQFTLSYINPSGRGEYSYSKTFYANATRR